MAQDGEGGGPPPMAPTNPFVKARNLPILVPQSLVVVDMSSHVSKFYGTKDEDPSRHMERYIENLASSFVTNLGYWLVWFPTTIEGEAYEWYRDHTKGHFRRWEHMQRESLNEFRPLVGQSMALRVLTLLNKGGKKRFWFTSGDLN